MPECRCAWQQLAHSCLPVQVVFLASKLATFSPPQSGGMVRRCSRPLCSHPLASCAPSNLSKRLPSELQYGYRLSKCAVRAAAAAAAEDLKPHGVSVIILHPGAVSN